MSKEKYTLVLGGSKGIGLSLVKYFNSKKMYTLSISRSSSNWESIYDTGLNFDLTEFSKYETLLEKLQTYEIENLIFNLGDGSIVYEDKIKQKDYSLKVNYLYAEKFVDLINDDFFKNIKNLIFINSICRFKNLNCREDYQYSKNKLFELFKNNVVNFSQKQVRLNSITLGDVLHDNSIWKNKFVDESQKKEYLKKTKLNEKFVNVNDVVSTVDFIINNPSIYGEDIVLDCGQTYLSNN
jgi:short-subunit dehydrogenase